MTPKEIPSLKILCAEDYYFNQIIVKSFLKKTHHNLEIVENGQIALNKFTADPSYDFVLMDIQMPVMDGLCATRAIRDFEKEYRLSPVPVIALTADITPENIDKMLNAGCTEHLAKPVTKDILLNKIEAYSENIIKRRSMFPLNTESKDKK